MARDFAAGGPIVVVLGDNIFEFSQSAAVQDWGLEPRDARIFVTEVEDPENFGVVVYENGRVADIVEKAGVVDLRYEAPPLRARRRGPLLLPARRLRRDRAARAVEPGELEITDVNRHYALEGRLDACEVEGWWEDAGKHWQHLADIGRRIDETGANKRVAS